MPRAAASNANSNEISIPSEWIARGRFALEERAGEANEGPRVDLELYIRPMGRDNVKKVMTTGVLLRFSIREVSLRMEGENIVTKGQLGDVLHLHGHAELDL